MIRDGENAHISPTDVLRFADDMGINLSYLRFTIQVLRAC